MSAGTLSHPHILDHFRMVVDVRYVHANPHIFFKTSIYTTYDVGDFFGIIRIAHDRYARAGRGLNPTVFLIVLQDIDLHPARYRLHLDLR